MKIDWIKTQCQIYDFHRCIGDGYDAIMINQAFYDAILEFYKNQSDLYNYEAVCKLYEAEKGKSFLIVQDNNNTPCIWTAKKEIICYDNSSGETK